MGNTLCKPVTRGKDPDKHKYTTLPLDSIDAPQTPASSVFGDTRATSEDQNYRTTEVKAAEMYNKHVNPVNVVLLQMGIEEPGYHDYIHAYYDNSCDGNIDLAEFLYVIHYSSENMAH